MRRTLSWINGRKNDSFQRDKVRRVAPNDSFGNYALKTSALLYCTFSSNGRRAWAPFISESFLYCSNMG